VLRYPKFLFERTKSVCGRRGGSVKREFDGSGYHGSVPHLLVLPDPLDVGDRAVDGVLHRAGVEAR